MDLIFICLVLLTFGYCASKAHHQHTPYERCLEQKIEPAICKKIVGE